MTIARSNPPGPRMTAAPVAPFRRRPSLCLYILWRLAALGCVCVIFPAFVVVWIVLSIFESASDIKYDFDSLG